MSIYLQKPQHYNNEVAKIETPPVSVKEKATTKIERIYSQFKKNPEITTQERAFLESVDIKRLPRRYEQLVTTILRHKSQKKTPPPTPIEIHNECISSIQTKDYKKLETILKNNIKPSSPNGTTILTTALIRSDQKATSIITSAGITNYFSFTLNKEHWTRTLFTVLGKKKSLSMITPDSAFEQGSPLAFTYALTHHLWGGFQKFVTKHNPEWISQGLVTTNSLREIENCILQAIPLNLETQVTRIREGLPVIIPLRYRGHAMTLVFVKEHVFYCNRGQSYPGQKKSIELYEFDTDKVDEKLLYTLQEELESKNDSFIYKTLKKTLNCKDFSTFSKTFSQFKDQSNQKNNNCMYASLKSAIYTLLISEHKESLTTKKFEALYEIYKECTAYFRDTTTAKFIEWKKKAQ